MLRAYLAVLVTFLSLHSVYSQFSQFSDFTDITFSNPLAYLWNNRENLVQDNYETCSVSNLGDTLSGICKNSFDCTFSRGRSVGRGTCGYLSTCCIYEKTCNATTDARVSYFKSPVNVRTNNELCRFRVQLANENICQIRIDFIQMTITKPVEVPIIPPAGGNPATLSTYKCTKDRFYVEPAQSDIPEICGVNNADSHIYLHLDNTAFTTKAITLNMLLAPVGTAGIEATPSWNIKVTQLECPGKQKKFNLQHKYSNPNQAAQDFPLLAPDGCLQYYTKSTGIVTSFGYSTQPAGRSYTTNQDYGICFKKDKNFCGVSLISNYINVRNPTNCQDYLYVPEAVPIQRVCGPFIPPATAAQPIITVNSNHPGPLYLHWHAQDNAPIGQDAMANGYGFSFNYNTKATACI